MTLQPPALRKHKFMWVILLTALFIAGGGLFFTYHSANKAENASHAKAARVPSVTITNAIVKDMPVYLEGLGTVQAYNTVTVQSQVQGQLVEVLFREGQEVEKGEVLARIDPRTYQAQLAEAEANKARDAAQLTNARHDLARYKQLGTLIAEQTLDAQRTNVAQLEAALQADEAAISSAKTALSYTTITAPIAGRTGIRQVDVGNIVQPGVTGGLVVITQLEPISVLFSLPATVLQRINQAINNQGKLPVDALDGVSGEVLDSGVLELVDNQIDQNTGTIRLKATFPNKERHLWPGGFVNARVLVEVRKESVVVPLVAVQQGPEGNYVFVVKADNTVTMRSVTLAFSTKEEAVIAAGLQAGEQIVSEGAGRLEEGTKVSIRREKSVPAP